MADRLQDLEHALGRLRGRYEALAAAAEPVPNRDLKLEDLREEIRFYEGLIAEHPDHKAASIAAQKALAAKALTPSATDPDTTGPDTGIPDAADLPAGQVLYQGTTGGQLGCIACDGQSRFINIAKSTTALGDAERAGQEIIWPENGAVVDFGIQIPQPNEGRYGINLFVNGAYSVGCPIETGSSSCRALAGQDPSPLTAGDRVTIIVGEQGTVDEDGVPVEEGDFVLEWWFVFQPE